MGVIDAGWIFVEIIVVVLVIIELMSLVPNSLTKLLVRTFQLVELIKYFINKK